MTLESELVQKRILDNARYMQARPHTLSAFRVEAEVVGCHRGRAYKGHQYSDGCGAGESGTMATRASGFNAVATTVSLGHGGCPGHQLDTPSHSGERARCPRATLS